MNKLDTKGTVMAETNSMQIEYSDRGLKLENFSDEMLFLEQVQLVPYNTEVLSHAKIGLDYFKQADLLMCKSYSMHSYCIHMALACYRQAIEALCFRWDWRWSVSDLLHFALTDQTITKDDLEQNNVFKDGSFKLKCEHTSSDAEEWAKTNNDNALSDMRRDVLDDTLSASPCFQLICDAVYICFNPMAARTFFHAQEVVEVLDAFLQTCENKDKDAIESRRATIGGMVAIFGDNKR